MKNCISVLRRLWLFALAVLYLSTIPTTFGEGATAFTYQGQLRDGGTNANGNYSIVFKLHDQLSGGNQVGPTVTLASQFITNGQFNVSLDFGGVFDGASRWMEISVEGNVLTPRTPLAPVPYALHASTAAMLSTATWNAEVGTYDDVTDFLKFSFNDSLVFGLSSEGVLVNGGLEAVEFHSGDLSISEAGGIVLPASDRNRSITATTLGINLDGISVSANTGITLPSGAGSRAIVGDSQGILVDGISISTANGIIMPATDRNRSIKASTDGITVDDIVIGNSRILLPSPNGNRSISGFSQGVAIDSSVEINGSLTASTLSLPSPGGNRTISANNQGIIVDGVSLSSANGVVLPNGAGGFVSITASGSGILIPLGQLTVNGPITCTSLNQTSDRAAKENFARIDSREILEKVAGLPISRWNFKTDTGAQHVGPMAQDFHAAFSLGNDDKHINTVDQGGIALAAIQGLNEVVKEKDATIAALQLRLENLEKAVATLTQQQKGANQ